MSKKLARRILEMLYFYCWGSSGSYELRNEFQKIYKIMQKEYNTGAFVYDSVKIKWKKAK